MRPGAASTFYFFVFFEGADFPLTRLVTTGASCSGLGGGAALRLAFAFTALLLVGLGVSAAGAGFAPSPFTPFLNSAKMILS